jgi:superfamily II DNA/RNA helicase
VTKWILDALGDTSLAKARGTVSKTLLAELSASSRTVPDDDFAFIAQSLELAAFDLLNEADQKAGELRGAAEDAFEHLRVLPISSSATHVLRTACYGVIADRTPDVVRYLRGIDLASPQMGQDWDFVVRQTVTNVWLRLIRKAGWEDLDAVSADVVRLREAQSSYEAAFLEASAASARTVAWELVALYHLARAAEILAIFTGQGNVSGGFNIREQLQAQFDRGIAATERAELIDLNTTLKLLARVSEQLVANSIWTVTRAVNSRVTRFVEQLVSRAHERPIFEMLPPQRSALRDNGLLGSGHRSVIVSLPTSSGKTLIAQFRMLQALNQFETERGWVAYIAPTRALVNQVCARLRSDFEPLGIVVERVSPALEVDGVEAEILSEASPEKEFRVLVGTPEKIDLLIRGGWEVKIKRPLTLVVVDEAHNIANDARGLRLELLLATINRECRFSQFLLLTPFVSNGADIAKWLSPDSNKDISVQFEWKPNDRAVVIAQPKRLAAKGDYSLTFSTVHTNRDTISVPEDLQLSSGRTLNMTWAQVSASLLSTAAATTHHLNQRGTTIVVASKVPHTWTLARTLQDGQKAVGRAFVPSANIDFVCKFVADEFGPDFELINHLKAGIGLHHGGLSDETRVLMEWLVERGELSTLVATTTISQGVNFPVSGVVLAGHQFPYGQDMSPEDFWNLAGRAGRVDQAALGIIALAANTDEKANSLRAYVQRNVTELNSVLFEMVAKAIAKGPLHLQTLYYMKEWSAFLQYLAHTYRQIGDHETFAGQIEQVLRGSFGFQKIRQQNANAANTLVNAVQRYTAMLRGKPLSLVDSTGFSWESVSRAMSGIRDQKLDADMWDGDRLFSERNEDLQKAFGVLFQVPEIREELKSVIGGTKPDGNLLARIVKDWVHGATISELAEEYFADDGKSKTDAISDACRSVYGKLVQTASWGLSAVQSITLAGAGQDVDAIDVEAQRTLRNLPARVYYGVNTDVAIDLRLLGVPRKAAEPLASAFTSGVKRGDTGHSSTRARLHELDSAGWTKALGEMGPTYKRVWQVLEGRERHQQ